MTFQEALIASGYTFQPECGAYVKEACGAMASYCQSDDDDNVWSFELYSHNGQCDELVYSKTFNLD